MRSHYNIIMKMGRYIKTTAFALGGVYLWVNCLFAYSPETNYWADRRKRAGRERSAEMRVASLPGGTLSEMVRGIPAMGSSLLGSQISDTVIDGLPAGFLQKNAALFSVLARLPGTVRKISLPPDVSFSGPIVIHVQDVHRNEEAQRNIGATVAGLLAEGKASLLALEGASGDISLQPFRDFQNRQAVRQAADYLLKENKISGPIHAVLTGTGPLCPVIGIDDPVHYSANVEAYRRSVPLLNQIQATLRARARILDEEKKKVFSAPLLEFDGRVSSYRARQLSLGDYVQVLVTRWKGELPTPALRNYSKAVDMERAMDFPRVERERNALIERLARNLSPTQEKDFLAVTLAYRAGQIRPADFYARLNRLCEQNGISLAAFPAMNDYLRYVLLADKINPESLYRDIFSLEQETYLRLARTPDERRLVAQSKTLSLTEKLVEFSLTPVEWEEYETRLSSATAMGEDLKPFESFYREAKIRDQAMADHFLRALGEPSGQVAVLVTGGFHAEGLTERLTQAGVTVVSFVPKIEKLDTTEGATYLSVFTQEKTPLDKLFLSEKLFLADHPVSPKILHTLLPVLVVVGTLYLGGLSLNLDPQVLYSFLGGVGILGAVKIVGDRIRFRLSGRKGETSLFIEMKRSGIGKVTEVTSSSAWGGKARIVRNLWVQTKVFLNNMFVDNPLHIRKEIIYLLLILVPLFYYNALISPVDPWVFLVSGIVSSISSTSKKPKIKVNGATIQKWFTKFRKAYLPLILLEREELSEEERRVSGEEWLGLVLTQIKEALAMNDTLGNLFTPEEAQDNFIHFLEALQTYLLLPNHFAVGDLTLFDRLLFVDRDHPLCLTYMGQPITVYGVTNVGTKTKFPTVMPTNTGALVGAVFVDPQAALEEAKSEGVVKQDREDVRYAILDWNIRIALARVKHYTSASLKGGLKTYESHGDPVLKSVLKPESPLWRILPPQKIEEPENTDDSQAKAYLDQVKTEMGLQIFAQLFEGTIEHFHHLRNHFQDENKSHALAFLAIKKMWLISQSNENESMRKGSWQFIESLGMNHSDQGAFLSEFFSPNGRFNSMDKLIASVEMIYQEHFISPEDRFFQIYNRNPSTKELNDLYGRVTVVNNMSQVSGIKNKTRPHDRTMPSPLVGKLLARGRTVTLPAGYRNERNAAYLNDATDLWDRYSENEITLEGFTQFLGEMRGGGGKKGLREKSHRIKGDPGVREYSALLEDLLINTAQNVYQSMLTRAQEQIRGGDYPTAIGALLKMKENDDFLDSLGMERTLALDNYLSAFRAGFSTQDPSLFPGITPLGNPELFGLDPQEVDFLSGLAKEVPAVSVPELSEDAIVLLRKKLGRFAPPELAGVGTPLQNQVPDRDEDIVSLLGHRIFLSKEISESESWRQHSQKILEKITQALARCRSDQEIHGREQINPMATGLSLRKNLRGIQRDYLQDQTLRFYYQIFADGNVAILCLENKGSHVTEGKMSNALDNKLSPYAKASSFFNPLYQGFRPMLVPERRDLLGGKGKGQARPLASLADRLAKERWGEGTAEYVRYTRYIDPAWEWIYSVPGLNLVGQWGLSDWIIRKIFPRAPEKVVRQVPGQGIFTLMGILSLGVGFGVGGAWLLVGAVFCALSLAYVFSGAHPGLFMEERVSLFQTAFWLALVLMAPTLILFWWDPVWLAGMGRFMDTGFRLCWG